MAVFQSARNEFLVTQQAAEELLSKLSGGEPITGPVLVRLEKLASACARLCYGNGLNSDLSSNVRILISWCDHLDDQEMKEKFVIALQVSPLRGLRE